MEYLFDLEKRGFFLDKPLYEFLFMENEMSHNFHYITDREYAANKFKYESMRERDLAEEQSKIYERGLW